MEMNGMKDELIRMRRELEQIHGETLSRAIQLRYLIEHLKELTDGASAPAPPAEEPLRPAFAQTPPSPPPYSPSQYQDNVPLEQAPARAPAIERMPSEMPQRAVAAAPQAQAKPPSISKRVMETIDDCIRQGMTMSEIQEETQLPIEQIRQYLLERRVEIDDPMPEDSLDDINDVPRTAREPEPPRPVVRTRRLARPQGKSEAREIAATLTNDELTDIIAKRGLLPNDDLAHIIARRKEQR